MTTLGRHLRPLWYLEPDATFLNHGSFGACPRDVLAAQSSIRAGMERQPDEFFRRKVFPGEGNAVRVAAARLAAFIGAKADRVAFVSNATEAVNTVLETVAFKPGDEILVLDCVYNAVRLAAERTCQRTGAKIVKVALPVPLTANDVVERIADAAGSRTRLAIIDHIASPTAIVFPVAEITRALKAKGTHVLIDGAHAVGQLELDMAAIGADWYTANAHKWLFAPKGSAFLYASADAPQPRPLSVSHWHDLGFPFAFDYVGTRDVTPFLTVPAALDFIDKIGADEMRAYLNRLSREGAELMRALGATPVAPDSMFAAMRTYMMPQRRAVEIDDVHKLMTTLWDKHRIQINASAFQGRLHIRLSAQIYVDRTDYERLVHVLEREGWPGR